ncbi:hypothetical protein [Mesorhizobium sp.]|uniref:hypothetical protein n=1 Tax=Mesorhizobium sp. TaxID=1871066 RepID=UPI00345BD3DD
MAARRGSLAEASAIIENSGKTSSPIRLGPGLLPATPLTVLLAFNKSLVCRFEQNQLAELRLYPVELGRSKRFANLGIPRLVTGPLAKAILERLQTLSEPFGTEILIGNDIGVIKLRPGSPQ